MDVLTKIFSSQKVHLTLSQKRFIIETFKILSIFSDNIEQIFYDIFIQTTNSSLDKHSAGEKFFYNIFCLRYPISSKKIQQLRKLKIPVSTLEFDETNFSITTKNVNLRTIYDPEEEKNELNF